MSNQTATVSTPVPAPTKPAPAPAAARTKRILEGPIFTTLMKLSAPNVLNLLAFTGMVTFDGFFLGKLGSDALAGASLVFPWVMLVLQSTNNGMGTGVSSAVARAIGAGNSERANALVFHAFLLALALGAIFAGLMLLGGPTLFRLMGGQDEMLDAALAYAFVALGGAAAICLLNFMGNAVRGTGNMALPAGVLVICVLAHIAISPILIFGFGPLPALGIRGAALALVVYYVVGSAVLFAALRRGRGGVRLTGAHPLRSALFRAILGVGGPAAVNSVMTNVAVALATAFVGGLGVHVLAGFGLGIRLEYLLIPVVFGVGAAMIPMIGMNVGAGNLRRAREIAWTGALGAAAITGAIGVAAALFAPAWIGLFTDDAPAIAGGAAYLRIAGPAYALIGLGLAFSFASQGARRMRWSVIASTGRGVVVAAVALVGTRLFGPSVGVVALAMIVALVVYAIGNTMPWWSAKEWQATGRAH